MGCIPISSSPPFNNKLSASDIPQVHLNILRQRSVVLLPQQLLVQIIVVVLFPLALPEMPAAWNQPIVLLSRSPAVIVVTVEGVNGVRQRNLWKDRLWAASGRR